MGDSYKTKDTDFASYLLVDESVCRLASSSVEKKGERCIVTYHFDILAPDFQPGPLYEAFQKGQLLIEPRSILKARALAHQVMRDTLRRG